jgi:hypothetical protein
MARLVSSDKESVASRQEAPQDGGQDGGMTGSQMAARQMAATLPGSFYQFRLCFESIGATMINKISNIATGFLKIADYNYQNSYSKELSKANNSNSIILSDENLINTTDNYSQSNKSAEENFALEITKRCKEVNKDDHIASKILSNSLISTENSIKNIFGQEKANTFMIMMLIATDGVVNETKLLGFIESTFD